MGAEEDMGKGTQEVLLDPKVHCTSRKALLFKKGLCETQLIPLLATALVCYWAILLAEQVFHHW